MNKKNYAKQVLNIVGFIILNISGVFSQICNFVNPGIIENVVQIVEINEVDNCSFDLTVSRFSDQYAPACSQIGATAESCQNGFVECFWGCFQFLLIKDNQIIENICIENDTHTFTNLSREFEYTVRIIYRHSRFCGETPVCFIFIDSGIFKLNNDECYPENLYINGASFDGSDVEGCILNGLSYVCKAWNNVDLAGTLFIADNYEVSIHAGSEVTFYSDDFETVFESNGENAGEFNFIVEPIPGFSLYIPQHNVNGTSGIHLAVNEDTLTVDGRMSQIAEVEESTEAQEEDDPFRTPEFNVAVQLFPNPTNGNTKLGVQLSEASAITVQLTDLSGKQLLSPFTNKSLSTGSHELSLSTSSLSSGMYLVHVTIGHHQEVIRLLKQ